MDRLKAVLAALDGDKNKLVLDLSCRRQGERWIVAMNKWETLTDMEVNDGKEPEAGALVSILICLGSLPRTSRTILFRVPGPCGGSRGVAGRNRRRLGRKSRAVVHYSRDIRRRMQEL